MAGKIPHATPRLAAILALAWLALCGAFYLEPQIDIAFSGQFFQARTCLTGELAPCGTFPAASDAVLAGVRRVFHVLPTIAIGAVALHMAILALAGRRFGDATQRLRLALIAAFALGPGLVVNVLLKDHWGRPRPRATDLFGGVSPFVPAGEISHYCASNCSFVSGEAAGVFMLPLLALLAPPSFRKPLFWLLTAFAALAALLRVAFGAHWLSDAMLGGLSTWVVFAVLAAWIERLAVAGSAQ
jgi:membrane-associated phospholipid phosphatase